MMLQSEEVRIGVLAGVEGFEPSHGGIKTRCLTAWLHPNNVNFLSAMFTVCQIMAKKYYSNRSTTGERLIPLAMKPCQCIGTFFSNSSAADLLGNPAKTQAPVPVN